MSKPFGFFLNNLLFFWCTRFCLRCTKMQGTADGCRILEFTAFIDGHALVNHVIRNLSLEQRDGCRIACYRDEECLSYNFGRIQNRTFICQLSDSDHVQHPADLRKRDNIGYQGTMNACSSNPCPPNSRCVVRDNKYRCKCKDGFEGKVCESENWKKINNDLVCFGAKEDKYGAFNITEAGEIYTFKLVYRSGYLRCHPRHPASHWGCTNSGAVAQEKALLTVITYNNRTALPIAEYARLDGSGGQKCPYYSYSIDGIDVNSTELVFNRLTSPVLARTGQEFQIWYGHDLVNCSEENNSGQTCVDVYGWYD